MCLPSFRWTSWHGLLSQPETLLREYAVETIFFVSFDKITDGRYRLTKCLLRVPTTL